MDFKTLYQNPKFDGAFSGVNRFIEGLKKRNVSTRGVKKALQKINSYTLHKPVKKPPKFRRVFTKRIGYLYQMDLVDMSAMEDRNDGFRWIVTIIDTFSKKAWVRKMKRKNAKSVFKVLNPFLRQNTPEKLETDQVSRCLFLNLTL